MILGIYTVRDSKAGAYMRPFYADNDPVAQRFCVDFFLLPDSVCSKHPEDFSLFWLGTFDDSTGVISVGEPRFILDFTSYFDRQEEFNG